MQVSAKRLFPNFSFLDAPFNLQYYKPGDYDTEVAYMGCRTRVMGNVYDRNRETTCGRGNLSFTSINLPRIGIEAKGDINRFYRAAGRRGIELVIRAAAAPFQDTVLQEGVQLPVPDGAGRVDRFSEKLDPRTAVAEVLKHGTL
jgi:hypothetical protein